MLCLTIAVLSSCCHPGRIRLGKMHIALQILLSLVWLFGIMEQNAAPCFLSTFYYLIVPYQPGHLDFYSVMSLAVLWLEPYGKNFRLDSECCLPHSWID